MWILLCSPNQNHYISLENNTVSLFMQQTRVLCFGSYVFIHQSSRIFPLCFAIACRHEENSGSAYFFALIEVHANPVLGDRSLTETSSSVLKPLCTAIFFACYLLSRKQFSFYKSKDVVLNNYSEVLNFITLSLSSKKEPSHFKECGCIHEKTGWLI